MKKVELFFIVLILTIILSGCNNQMDNSHSTDGISDYNGIMNFLLNNIKDENTFISSKLANIDGDNFEQTYYHMKIQNYVGIAVNEQTKNIFNEELNKKINEDIYFLKFFDTPIYSDKIMKLIKDYIKANEEITNNNIENYYIVTRYLGKDNTVFNPDKVRDFLEKNIPFETDSTNRLTLLYWYTDLVQNKCIEPTNEFFNDYINYLNTDFNLLINDNDIYKYEKLYYYLWICKVNDIEPNINNQLIDDIPDALPYTFSASEIYYAIKCLNIQNYKFKTKSYFEEYYRFVKPTVNGMYPSFTIETNNMIEEYRTFLLLKYFFNIDNSKTKMSENHLMQLTKANLFKSNSATQSYYEALFCNLQGIEVSQDKADLIKKNLQDELSKHHAANNIKVYYYYLTMKVLGIEISQQDKEFIISQYNYCKTEKNIDSTINYLDLISLFQLMKQNQMEEEYKAITEIGKINAEDTYNHYIQLGKDLGNNIVPDNQRIISTISINGQKLVKNSEGIMYISTVYYYILCNFDNKLTIWR